VERQRPTVVCLCGSTRFWRTFQTVSLSETLAGRIVLSVGAATASDEEHDISPEQKTMLDILHLHKIDLCDEVIVLNEDDYMGDSTRRELYYTRSIGRRVRWLHPSRYAVVGEFTGLTTGMDAWAQVASKQ